MFGNPLFLPSRQGMDPMGPAVPFDLHDKTPKAILAIHGQTDKALPWQSITWFKNITHGPTERFNTGPDHDKVEGTRMKGN